MSDYSFLWKRENPFYSLHKDIWERSRAAYSGGTDYIDQALIKHISEVDLEFAERRRRAYYFNYPRKIARLITQYVLGEEPRRRNTVPELEEDFSRSGLRVNEVMRQFSTMLNVYGAAWLLVDMPGFTGELDPERQKRERIRPYALTLSPLAVVDWSYGEDGALAWAVVAENGTYSPNPFLPPVRFSRRRLWTRDEWYLFERENDTARILLKESAVHGLGRVPLIRGIESDGFGMDANH
jgi:urease gamma subunit